MLTVYDKAVEYISGGSNVPDIRKAFWEWKRSHYPQTESSLNRWSYNLTKPNEVAMQNVGIFGGTSGGMIGGGMMMLSDGSSRVMMGAMGGGMAMKQMAQAPMGLAMAKAAAPASAGPERLEAGNISEERIVSSDKFDGSEGQPPVQPVVRTNFADTAYWVAAITTAPDGTAEVEFPLPESLTTWKVKTWTLGQGTRVGQGESEIVTTKDLLVRIQAPGSSSRRTRWCSRPTFTTSSRRRSLSGLSWSLKAACSSR